MRVEVEGAIGCREDIVQFKEAMTGKSGDSTEVRSEGESRVEVIPRDDLTVISDVLWFEPVALFPFKEHPNRFCAA